MSGAVVAFGDPSRRLRRRSSDSTLAKRPGRSDCRRPESLDVETLLDCDEMREFRPPSAYLFIRLDRPELDVAERDLPVIALEGEVANIGLGEARHLSEFALGDAGVEVFAA